MTALSGLSESLSRGGALRFLLVATTAFLTVVDLFATQAIIPSLTAAYGVSPAAMGAAVNACTIGMAVASLVVALVSPRLDRRAGIVVSLVVLAVPTALLAVAPNLAVFAALRVMQGLCMATAFTLTLAHLGETSGSGTATAFAAYVTGNVASNLIGRLIASGVAGHWGTEANFLVFSALNLLGAALVSATIQGAPRARAASRAGSLWAPAVAHLTDPRLLPAFATGFCILFAFIGVFTYVNFLLASPMLGLGMMEIGLVYLVFLPSILTTPLAGRLSARLGFRPALWSGLALAGLGLVLLLGGDLTSILAGMTLVAVGTFLAQALVTGYVGRAARGDRAAASGLYLAGYFSGGLAGAVVLGQAFMRWEWPGVVAGVAVALAAAGLLATRLRLPGE